MQKKMTVATRIVVSGLMLLTLLAFGSIIGPYGRRPSAAHAGENTQSIDEALVAHADRLSKAFRQAVSVAQPGVVTIISEKRIRSLKQFRRDNSALPEELHRFLSGGVNRFLFLRNPRK